MKFGQLHYLNDELTAWSRSIEFQKKESSHMILRIGAVKNQREFSGTDAKTTSQFVDQFMVQDQKFENLANQIASQQFRLEKISMLQGNPMDEALSQHQDLLRARMHTNERSFMRIKFACSSFISAFMRKYAIENKQSERIMTRESVNL